MEQLRFATLDQEIKTDVGEIRSKLIVNSAKLALYWRSVGLRKKSVVRIGCHCNNPADEIPSR